MNKIYLTGSIGFSFWDEEFFTAKDVRDQLEGLSGPLTVHLNSGGGVASEGQAIYTALKNYAGEVSIVIDGIAASAASLVAMAGDEIVMPLGAIMMIHDPATWAVSGRGTEEDHLEAAKALKVIANAYAAVYAARAGISIEAAREIMKAETYFDGPAALEAGFATAADEATEAATAAAFDYRIYAKAPKSLRALGAHVPRAAAHSSVIAMMAGATTSKAAKENPMKRKPTAQTAAKTTAALEEDEDKTTLESEDETTAESDEDLDTDKDETTAEGGDELDEGNDETDEDADPIASIIRFATARGLPAAMQAKYIANGFTLKQVMALHPQKGSHMSLRPGAPRMNNRRDERTTRRAAATEALHAQMTGAQTVSPAARPFMTMSIVEIAAAVSDQGNARMRNWGEREQVFMTASHSTSDFPAIFENALNKTLLERYSEFEPTYRQIAKKKNFRDFRPMPLVRAGDFPMLKKVPETGEIKFGTFGESGEQALIAPYASGIAISRQMLINDDLGAIADMMANYGETVAYFEESTFYAAMLAAKMSDGKAVFHADHKNLGTAAPLTQDALSLGRAAMRKQKSKDGISLNLAPSILLVGADNETEAERIVADITPGSADDVNPFARKLRPVVTGEITGAEWFLLSERAPCFVYGFLEGREAPRMRTEEPFGTQGFRMTVEHDFGFGAADFRGGYKNPGQ